MPYEYDEDASVRLNVDVVYEAGDQPRSEAQWLGAMRRLNAIDDALARRLLELHRDCGSGSGECDSIDDEDVSMTSRRDWGCETTAVIAGHFGVDYPG